MREATLSSFPSSFMQKKSSSKRHQGGGLVSLFEENNKSKHNRTNQGGSNHTQPLTSGIFIVSGEQLMPFLDAI